VTRNRADGWDELRTLWRQAEGPVPPSAGAVRRLVRRRQWRLAATLCGEVVVTGFLVVATVWRIGLGLDAFWWTWLVLVWASWMAAVGFALWNRRGVWRCAERSTRAFLRLLVERSRRHRRTARFVLLFVAVQGLAVAVLLAWAGLRGDVRQGAWSLSAAVCGLYVLWALWYGRWARREEARLGALYQAWEASREDAEDPPAPL
jgi:Kef-type K+ transport system membrane component KefB